VSGLTHSISRELEAKLGRAVSAATPVAGGDINDAWRVDLEGGDAAFVKSRMDAGSADFRAEAAGLAWLGEVKGARIPKVVAVGVEAPFLALEWIERGSLSAAGGEELGRSLAEIHRAGAEAFGSLPPAAPDSILRLGSVEVGLVAARTWADLYRERLVMPLVRRTVDNGSLDREAAAAVESVAERFDELCGPAEPPARLHGDLWGGNVLAGADGTGWLIDPAAYGGHREVDLAMLRLFGAPSELILSAYAEAFPPSDGHEERVELFQLLPLLVHTVLFGGQYGAAAGRAARRYL
jgi:fructosamine-3-kinase